MQKSLLLSGGDRPLLKGILPILFFLACAFHTNAQRTVTGKVISGEDQAPLPGVNIIVKGTSNGTITDVDGLFSIGIGTENDVLVFSFVGFLTKEENVGTRNTVDITLGPDPKELSEVVVTALGIKKELRTIGYTTQEVKGQDLVKAREPNPVNSLTAKVAGLTVGPSAELLGRPTLVLRGRTDILFVVDGVSVNSDTWNVSADDIETIWVAG